MLFKVNERGGNLAKQMLGRLFRIVNCFRLWKRISQSLHVKIAINKWFIQFIDTWHLRGFSFTKTE